MFDRDIPKAGEKWRYFEGEAEHWVVAIAFCLKAGEKRRVIYSKTLHQWDMRLEAKVFDTESFTIFDLHQTGSSEPEHALFILTPTNEFWSVDDITDETLWGRPLESFMEVLSSANGGQSSNWYRFERC